MPNLPAASSVVPAAFAQNMAWSEEGSWHWVNETYDGTTRYTGTDYDVSYGKGVPVPFYVATLVRSLAADDRCDGCVLGSNFQQGPPNILGGPDNPILAAAYAHLQNGPRELIRADGGSTDMRWTKGVWYLNYDPTSGSFISWSWVPADWTPEAEARGSVPAPPAPALKPLIAASSMPATSAVPAAAGGVRVFPLSGSYQVTQPYGCVPANAGYPSPPGCPAYRPSFHDGLDLGAPAGTPIFAAASGTVLFAGLDATASHNSKIVIGHDGANADFQTVYLHWQKAYVTVGQHVSAGQVIAEVGSVGYSTGPHLHFSIVQLSKSATIDPLAWLQASAPAVPSAPVSVAVTIRTSDATPVLRWAPFMSKAASDHNVPVALLAAIMTIESDGNPNAISPQGAQGLMQIMPDEFQRLGVPVDKWLDPQTNIDTAARLLAETLHAGGSVELAITRYFGIGCDALGTCTDVYLAKATQWLAYYQSVLPR